MKNRNTRRSTCILRQASNTVTCSHCPPMRRNHLRCSANHVFTAPRIGRGGLRTISEKAHITRVILHLPARGSAAKLGWCSFQGQTSVKTWNGGAKSDVRNTKPDRADWNQSTALPSPLCRLRRARVSYGRNPCVTCVGGRRTCDMRNSTYWLFPWRFYPAIGHSSVSLWVQRT